MEPNNNPNPNRSMRSVLLVVGVALLVVFGIWMFVGGMGRQTELKYSEVISYFKNGEVQSYTLDFNDGKLTMLMRPDHRVDTNRDGLIDERDVVVYNVPSIQIFLEDIQDYQDSLEEYDRIPATQTPWFVSLLPSILLMVLFGVFIWFMMRRTMNGMDGGKIMGFGKAKVKKPGDDRRKVTFDDVAGADEEKEDLAEIVEFLRDSKKYTELGARVPKGVLLIGPPGTGKTLLARAVAGEAGVPFFSISGSDFVEMYVGVGASRVRDLFDNAKKNAPCIIFVDEIDAVGRQRGTGLGGGHDEREQTLNQMLVEMDGFGANEGVIVMAATNRPDILDPALTRPGRFDRQIVVNVPDIKGREEILKVHSRGKPLGPDVELATIAKATAGFTGADLENLLNEAALLSARKGLHSITMEEIEEATIKVVVGTEKRSHVISEEDKRITAYHEAGHAVVSYYSPTQDPVHQISIIPRGMAAGYTMNLPEEDKTHMTKTEMLESIQVMLGGRAAEALVLDDICTGASNDIERASATARKMVTKYGMSDKLGPIMFGESDSDNVFLGRDLGHTRNYSEEVAAQIDNEVNHIINNGYKEAQHKLKEHLQQLHKVAQYLLEHEKMDRKEFEAVMSDPALPSALPEIPPLA